MDIESASTISFRPPAKKRTSGCLSGLGLLAGLALAWWFCGVFTIQPIGALPEGATLVIWRGSARPFFDSPDRLCLDIQGGVSLMCRAAALGALKPDRVVVRLPYLRFAYLLSTNGQEFER